MTGAPATAPRDVTVAANASHGPAAVAQVPPLKHSLVVPAAIGIALAAAVGLLVIGFLLLQLGPGAVLLAGVLALIPLAIVLLGIRWIDKWEREPPALLLFAFLWGAAVSVFAALVVGFVVEGVQVAARVSDAERELLGSVIQAPFVEELAKGLGILLIFLGVRKHFDGPVDGIAYGATIAAGFAFTENILYFGVELVDGGSSGNVFGVFIIRGLMSPFAHVMFTICTGLAIGIAARRRGVLGGFIGFVIGLVPAMLLHALWNGATYVVGEDFFGYYFVVQVPLFIAAVVLVVALRRQETMITRDRLAEYAAAGWFNPDEITALATPAGRRQAIAWASQRGLRDVMKGYIRDSTELALVRQRLIRGAAIQGAAVEEQAILASILTRRRALTATATTAAAPPV